MLYRLFINLGIFTLGYYIGRELGRTESAREQLRQAREQGGNVYLGEAEVVHNDKVGQTDQVQPGRH